MTQFAATTSVSPSASADEIDRTLRRYGADQFMYGWAEEAATVGFRLAGRQVRFAGRRGGLGHGDLNRYGGGGRLGGGEEQGERDHAADHARNARHGKPQAKRRPVAADMAAATASGASRSPPASPPAHRR